MNLFGAGFTPSIDAGFLGTGLATEMVEGPARSLHRWVLDEKNGVKRRARM